MERPRLRHSMQAERLASDEERVGDNSTGSETRSAPVSAISTRKRTTIVDGGESGSSVSETIV